MMLAIVGGKVEPYRSLGSPLARFAKRIAKLS
jgi:hypothetical protein